MKPTVMKNAVFALGIVLLGLNSCQKEEVAPTTNPSATVSLSSVEVDDLNFLIQEEKLARDVYIYAYQKHGVEMFNNISSSEQSHVDQIAALLNQYDIANPIIELNVGEFHNATLQQLYIDLVNLADSSVVHGYRVGAIIEDLDIHDIHMQYANTNNLDLITLYDRLTCGSRNHMRSFYAKLLDNGVVYEPQYISQEELDTILSSEMENCN